MRREVWFILAGLCACDTPPLITQKTSETVAICSAGYGVTLNAELAAEVNAVEQGGAVSAKLEQSLKGHIFAGADLSDETVLSGYEGYLDCVQQRKGQADFISALESRRDLVLSFLSGRGYSTNELAKLTELIQKHISATRAGEFQTAHDLHNQINLELIALRISNVESDGPVAFYDL